MKRILVTGTRHGWNYAELRDALDTALADSGWTPDFLPPVLVHGDAPGVDRQAAAIWSAWGFPTEAHPADWEGQGRKAGPLRNEEMVSLGADLCLAFVHPTSRGTLDCIRRAKRDGIPVIIYKPTPAYERNAGDVDGQMTLFGETKE